MSAGDKVAELESEAVSGEVREERRVRCWKRQSSRDAWVRQSLNSKCPKQRHHEWSNHGFSKVESVSSAEHT